MKIYQVDVTVHNAPVTSKSKGPIVEITFMVKAANEVDAKVEALNLARRTQEKHPRIYKGATFTVDQDAVKIFT